MMAVSLCRMCAAPARAGVNDGKVHIILTGKVCKQRFYDRELPSSAKRISVGKCAFVEKCHKDFWEISDAVLKTIPIYGNLIVPEGTIF